MDKLNDEGKTGIIWPKPKTGIMWPNGQVMLVFTASMRVFQESVATIMENLDNLSEETVKKTRKHASNAQECSKHAKKVIVNRHKKIKKGPKLWPFFWL